MVVVSMHDIFDMCITSYGPYGGFLEWGYPKMDGLFHVKSNLEMDEIGMTYMLYIYI